MLALDGIEASHGGFSFGPIDLRVDREVLTVLGPSGSGKTTLLSLVAGLLDADAGSITLDGRSLDDRPLEARGVGLVFQDGALFPHMTARENIVFATDEQSCVGELAASLEITDVLDRRPAALSGGERQRVALARTLAAEPDALLLDEPLSSLDAPVRRRLRDVLEDLFTELDVPIVYVTHDQRAATALGDRMAVIRNGRLEQLGTPTDVNRRPASRFVAAFTGSDNFLDGTVIARNGDDLILQFGEFTLRARGEAAVDETITTCIRPSRLRLVGPHTDFDDDGITELSGTVDRWTNEGDVYRVVVGVAGSDVELTASVPPTTFDRLALESPRSVRVGVPPAHVHLIP